MQLLLFSEDCFSKESLRKEIEFVESLMRDLDFEAVFSHNDFYSKNLIYDETCGKYLIE